MATAYGKEAYKYTVSSADFSEQFYDWDVEEVKKLIKKTSENKFLYIKFNYRQIGRDEKWFEEQVYDLGKDWAKIRREVLLEWNRASSDSPYDQNDLDALITMSQQHTYIRDMYFKKYYQMKFYEAIDIRVPMLIGVDVSSGIGKDSSTIVLVNSKTKHIVGIFENSRIDIDDLADVITEIVRTIARNSVICIERNNVGAALIAKLIKRPDIEPKIYRELNKDDLKQKLKDGMVEGTNATAANYGIWTDETKRAEMHDKLAKFVHGYKDRVCAYDFVEQVKGLVFVKGRVDHLPDQHDDIVMGYLMAIWTYYFGNNTSAFGLVRVPDPEPGLTVEEDLHRKFLQKLDEETKAQNNLLDKAYYNEDNIELPKSMRDFIEQQQLEVSQADDYIPENPNGGGVIDENVDQFVQINPYQSNSFNNPMGNIFGGDDQDIDFNNFI